MNKVLLIDDDLVLLKLYSTRLISDGIEVKTASNGEMGLEMITDFAPDLVVVDLLMPKLNGFVFLERLSNHPQLKNIKKLVFSSVVNEEQLDRIKSLNVSGYLNKIDTTPSQLVEKIHSLLDISK